MMFLVGAGLRPTPTLASRIGQNFGNGFNFILPIGVKEGQGRVLSLILFERNNRKIFFPAEIYDRISNCNNYLGKG
jgi:hypothetical protein